MRRAPIALVAGLAILLAAEPGPAAPVRAASAAYFLPVPAGTQVYVTQGNGEGNHTNKNNGKSQYAFDFALEGNPEFPVAAARAGTVAMVRSDSTNHTCGSEACASDVNYVVVDHGDGTSALYLHLATGKVQVSGRLDPVVQGQVIATADSTGWSTKNHLHFQVEQTVKGKWWTDSVQVSFSDQSVLARYPSGVPASSRRSPTPRPTSSRPSPLPRSSPPPGPRPRPARS